MFRGAQQARLPMFRDTLNKRKTCGTRYKGGGQQTGPARKPLRGDSAFGGAASCILRCSRPSLGVYSRKTLKIAKNILVFW